MRVLLTFRMTKLNLSALKKKADILAHPSSEVSTHDLQTSGASTATQTFTSDSTVLSSGKGTFHLENSSSTPKITQSLAVKEFFPNLTVSDELFDDIFAKKETISVEETPQVYETQSILTDTPIPEIATPSESILLEVETTTVEILSEQIPPVD